MDKPASGQKWRLKSDHKKVLIVSYTNCNDIVGFSGAEWRKRSYGTLRLDLFLQRYERV